MLAAFDRAVAGPEFTPEDQRLVQAFAATAATAVMTAQNVAAQGLRRSVEASERERVRWARELHDETLQELAALRIVLSSARNSPALEALVDRTRRLSGLTITTDIDLAYEAGREPERHLPETEVAIYRLVQEGLTNAVKHAGDAVVHVAIAESADAVTIVVRDDGPGFTPDAHHEGFGLLGLRERVELVGGTLKVRSGPGAGTTLEASLPTRRRTATQPAPLDVAS